MTMKVHHIGIKVKNIDIEKRIYNLLGYSECGEKVIDNIQHNDILFLKNGEDQIELIQSCDSCSTVYSARMGIHHICFLTDDIDNIVNSIHSRHLGKKVYSGYAPAMEYRRIVFVLLVNSVLLEFVEERGNVAGFI